ncbi:helix-turn-helix domain-containing protein [Halanaeroarchaeum sulfurireducens]|uniref:Transcription regulator n=1 Tax=Halanaeroarchaeum sulfurireducens TaxID=1604004 RepID=A0A0F7PC41_9EURY|nr:helix-turn-helix domain-containing protein [Halanaeroarchaeum sulfurireducens]AKH97194.1 transcription regulator [Halanaeroarchaeum sulfurireducens]
MGEDREDVRFDRWGYRLEYRVQAPEACPVRRLDAEVTDVTVFWGDGTVNCDFVTRSDDGEISVRHYCHSNGEECPCSAVFENGAIPRVSPVRDESADELLITTYVGTPTTAESITASLHEVSSSVEVVDYREIGPDAEWSARVDLSALTDKQREAIRTAMYEGYYETPSETTIESLASLVGISSSAFATRLRNASTRLSGY